MLEEDKKAKKTLVPERMFGLFFGDILGLDVSLAKDFQKIISQLLEEFGFALSLFTEFDDNKAFFSLLWENWKDFVKVASPAGRNDEPLNVALSAEDLLRLRGTLKHITYYNKRYLIPG
jgi:hypothetical protein